ncbi:hypothetical protein Zmor_018067 [Zophobas morio]|uniref:Uncharacterized protein n=1 Tax=Zophobas morio TaxID=2755281 RepID=A0AA38MCR7_9CUCU|nr:hypothetical protein Zmor_018067 [Zophobas morio]
MWNRCVVEWLKKLRYDIDYYDEVLLPCEYEEMNNLSASYENLWECYSENAKKVALKYGEVCRVSVVVDEEVENLKVAPILYECLDPDDLPEDVIMWKKHLRHTYYGEDENFLENEVDITIL